MFCALESQRLVYNLLSAFMPDTAAKGLKYLGCDSEHGEDQLKWGSLRPGTLVTKAEPLFPRIEDKGDL